MADSEMVNDTGMARSWTNIHWEGFELVNPKNETERIEGTFFPCEPFGTSHLRSDALPQDFAKVTSEHGDIDRSTPGTLSKNVAVMKGAGAVQHLTLEVRVKASHKSRLCTSTVARMSLIRVTQQALDVSQQ